MVTRTDSTPEEPSGSLGDDRAVSTVVDVSLALLLISASIVLMGVYLDTDEESIDGDRGDRAMQTLTGSTIGITYDVSSENATGHATTDSDHYEIPENLDPDEDDVAELYEITTYGSATDLLAEAALTNLHVDGVELFAYGYDVERSVDAVVQDRLIGAEGRTYAVATWKPYTGGDVSGTVTTGEPPPESVDVAAASTTVSTDVDSVDPERLTDLYLSRTTDRSGIDDGFDLVAEAIATVLVEAYFPAEETQYTLESTLSENAVTVYQYRQFADVAGVDVDNAITGSAPDATTANDELVGEAGDDDGLTAVIAEDLRNSTAGEEIRATADDIGSDPTPEQRAELERTFEEHVSTGEVTITVQTWGAE